MSNLWEQLREYGALDVYPFHMPGHKRQFDKENPMYQVDITEIDGWDDLHHADGIILDCEKQYADMVGARKTYYLINGSSCGILSSIFAATSYGGSILMGRNAHKSAYHAAYLRGLNCHYIYPSVTDFDIQGSITANQVEEALAKHPEVSAVYITSPTYDGVVSDVASIAEVVHKKGKLLIVDEAHGAHFFLDEGGLFPHSAVRMGADLVIQSVHKTLPSLTQTAVLHLASPRIHEEQVEKYLRMFQSSSPSYVLMSAIHKCSEYVCANREELVENYRNNYEDFIEATKDLRCLGLYTKKDFIDAGCYDFDCTKVLIHTNRCNLTGLQLHKRLLEDYHLQMEMCSGNYVTALTSIMDTKEGWIRLATALLEIDRELMLQDKTTKNYFIKNLYRQTTQAMGIMQAEDSTKEDVVLEQSYNKVCGSFVYLYPPGIPILVPGEVIEKEVIDGIKDCIDMGFSVEGLSEDGRKIPIVNM